MVFKETNSVYHFFEILPVDWQQSILPFWQAYKNTTKCYIILENNKPIAGGLVFSECSPDMLYNKEEADIWFENGYLYLGYIYVLEEKRGNNLGSIWLSNLKDKFPKQKYWLTIDDLGLHDFYIKNGFKKVKSLLNKQNEEIIYCFEGV